MSSTNRGAVRTPNDFYVTPPAEIQKFLRWWCETDQEARAFWERPRKILDPAAGGLTEEVVVPPSEKNLKEHLKGKEINYTDTGEYAQWVRENGLVFKPSEMSYPQAIGRKFAGRHTVDTLDIRENSRAAVKGDYLAMDVSMLMMQEYDMVITNPPFSLAIEFIKRSLEIVKPGGYVVMLLRLNFFGSDERNEFFLSGNMPDMAYVHSKRLGFTPDSHKDSVEYVHAIWRRDRTGNPVCHETKLRVLPY